MWVRELSLDVVLVMTPLLEKIVDYVLMLPCIIKSKLEIGWSFYNPGNYIAFEGPLLGSEWYGTKSGPLMKAIEDISLSLAEEDGQVKVTSLIRDNTGEILAKIRDNEWGRIYNLGEAMESNKSS